MENLFPSAFRCLQVDEVVPKTDCVRRLFAAWQRSGLALEPHPEIPGGCEAGRPPRPELVAPRLLPRRRLGTVEGRAAMIHAIAHIEFNAINLALDALCRFQEMPRAYYGDWLRVAVEETHHFELVRKRLLDLGCDYGDFPAHNGLWELAQQTAHDPLVRMALVPRVMEARGLDVTPGIMEKFRALGDEDTVAVLKVILRDEIGHVEAGSRWFHHLCKERELEPEATYFDLLSRYLRNRVSCPLHRQARLQAGFSRSELERLERLCGS
jgi:uncharacterized ferritin-like protein (DUF455 family)